MKKDKRMSLEEHIVNANDLAIATHYLKRIFFRCREYYSEESRLMEFLSKILPSSSNEIFTEIKDDLEDDYQSLINEKELEQYGKIYHNLEKRYEKLKEDFIKK
ncbi:MAG: hypothetical protein P8130_01905 [Deltaproteobacteria bacterium]